MIIMLKIIIIIKSIPTIRKIMMINNKRIQLKLLLFLINSLRNPALPRT